MNWLSDQNSFLAWEARSRDTIEVKRCYIDVAGGDLIAGILLSQIIYWNLPDEYGESRLKIVRDGYQWLAKKRDDWWQECRITPKQFDTATKLLEAKNLIKTAIYKFGSSPTKHLRINWQNFLSALTQVVQNPPLSPERIKTSVASGSDEKGNLPKGENGNSQKVNFSKGEFPKKGNSQKVKMEIPKRVKFKCRKGENDLIETEITTETTVKREEQHSPSPDFSPNDEISSLTPQAQHNETDFSTPQIQNEQPDPTTPLPQTEQPNSNFSSSLSNSESLHQNENTSFCSIVPGSFGNLEQTNLANSSTVVTDSLSSRNAAKLQRYQQLDAEGIKLKQPELRDWARLEIGDYVRTYRKSGFILTGGNDVSGEFAVYVAKQNCRKGQQPTIALGFNVINKCEQDPRSWQKLVVWVTEWQQLRQTGQQVNVAAVLNQQQQIERIRQAANTKFEL